jgi:hypothetical protein
MNPAIHHMRPMMQNIIPVRAIGDRLYMINSEVEADLFDHYWNDRPATMQENGNDGCRGIVVGLAIVLFFLALILSAVFSCAPKAQAPTLDKHRGKKVKPTLVQDSVEHRPRYNHWAKPFEL